MPKGPEHQHYVPRFILKNFSLERNRQQVPVFRKSTQKGFTGNISKIMGETRFHEFALSEAYRASFEESIGKIESWLLPTYRQIIAERRLKGTIEERAALALFMAFQFVRTRRQRDRFVELEELVADKLAKMGSSLSDLDDYEPLDRDSLTEQHINFMREGMGQFAETFADKHFLLMEPPAGRSFWLADNPVCLHNSEPADDFFGNIGLGVRGIEVYLPLSHDLMIAALCPSLATNARKEIRESRQRTAVTIGTARLQGVPAEDISYHSEVIEEALKPATALLDSITTGTPLSINDDVMDFCCSLQLAYARDFVILPRGDYQRARKFSQPREGRADSPRLAPFLSK